MKKITFVMACLLGLIFTSYSQVQIGSGNNLTQNTPFNIAKNYSYSQSIYLNSEINSSGTITTIQWYFSGVATLTNNQELVVYMGTTTKTDFTSISDWVPFAELTQVYSGGITTDNAPGWKTITLTTPFVYNGTSNLVIAVDENGMSNDGTTDKFNSSQTASVRSLDYGNNSTNPNPASLPTTGTSNFTLSNYVPNIILGGLTQTCTSPINISYTNINDTSVTLNWENQGTVVPTEGYDIYISTESAIPTVSDVADYSTNATNLTITDLLSNTQYYVYLKSKCSLTDSSTFSELSSFKTSCAAVTSFIEGFEEVTTPELPSCWSKILRGPSLVPAASIKSVTTNINLSNQSVALASSSSVGQYDIILVSPYVSNIAEANNRLEFYAKGTGNLQIGTLSTNDENAVFTLVENIEVDNTTSLYTVNFDYAISTDHFIGIRLNETTANKTTTIDDIKWEAIPTCPDVTEIMVPEVTPETATINWVSSIGGETSWDIAVGSLDTIDPSTLSFTTSTTNGIQVMTNLDADTSYKVWVRSVCGTDKGSWRGPVIFRTECTDIIDFTENFDSTPASTLPTCWFKILTGETLSANANVRTVTSNAYSGTTALQLLSSNSTGDYNVIAVSPRLSTLALGTYRIKFHAKGVGVLELGTVDTATNFGTFNSLGTVTSTANYAEYTFNFTNYTGTDTHFGIRLSSETTNTTIYIDDIIWEVSPLCPDVTSILVDNITSDTATINWAENLELDTWNIAIGESTDTDPSTLPFYTSTTQGSYNATDLEDNTTYNVWVRSNCGTDLGAWIGPVSFHTNCTANNTFNENFDTVTTPELPSCWSKIIYGETVSTSAIVNTIVDGSAQSSPNMVKIFNANSTGAYDIMLVSPYLEQNVISGSRVKFYAKSIAAAVLDVVTMNSNSPGTTYTVIQTIPISGSVSEYIVNLDGASSNDTFVGFRLNATSGYKTLFLDNIVLEPIPTCLDVSNIIVTDIATESATLNWTANGSESAWEIAIGAPTVTDPNTLTPISSDSESYILEDLTPATYYNVWVRSVCGTDLGGWIGPVTFSTACNPATTIDENFDNTPYLTLPLCWNSIIRNGANLDSAVAVSSGGVGGTHGLTIYAANSSTGADVILVSPSLSNLVAGTHSLSFVASGSNDIEIGTLNSNTFDAIFTPFQTFTLTESNQTINVNFASYSGTDTYIGFRIVTGSTTTSSQYIGLDNVVWEQNLTNGNFDSTPSMVYPNPVRDILNIQTIKELNSVSVYNIMGQQVLNVTQNLSQINMSSLSNGAYLVKLNGATFTETLKVIKN